MASENTLHTDAIVSYDGIFKGMHDPQIRQKFFKARELLSEGKFDAAKTLFNEALGDAKDNVVDSACLSLIYKELQRYEQYTIKEGTKPADEVQWGRIMERPLQRLNERSSELPQSVFFLDIGKPFVSGSRRLLGRKILSDFWIAGKIPELHCSLVSADMILGVFVDQRITESDIHVYYHALTNSEKLKIMNDIIEGDSSQVEIIFPFPLLRESTGKELRSPEEGWVVDDSFDVMLGCGEERIRDYTIKFLTSANLASGRLYDPACSTGVFLSTLKEAFPTTRIIGQDLSKQMVGLAKARVDEVHCGNAMEPMIESGTADVTFNRFLNSEVVASSDAETLLAALLPTVKQNGYMVTFGHTPVLLSSSNFRMLPGFSLLQSIGVATDKAGIFQYYIIQKT